MNLETRPFAHAALTPTLLVALGAGALRAQVPEHHAVVGTVQYQAPTSPPATGDSGIFFVPLPTTANPAPTTPIPVTGLPPELVQPPTVAVGGAWSVVHRPSDGTLFVGDGSTPGNELHVHVLTLTGNHVTAANKLVVGRLGNFTNSVGLDLLPNDRLLVATSGTGNFVPGSGPAADSPLNILNLSGSGPLWTNVPLTGTLGNAVFGAVATPDGKTAYITTFGVSGGNPPCYLYEVNINPASPSFGLARRRYTWGSHQALTPALHDGTLSIACYNPTTFRSDLFTFDTRAAFTARRTPASPANVALYGPAVDPASDQCLIYSSPPFTTTTAFQNAIVTSRVSGGALSLLAAPPSGGWGKPFAIDVNRSIDPYGVDTPGVANRYGFVDCPNPGGLPQVGNASYSLTVESIPGTGTPPASWLLVGPAATQTTVLGVELLVALGPATFALPADFGSPPTTRAEVGIPIPNDPTLQGLSLFAQSIHAEAGGIAASAGIEFTIF